jgi:hypothetical protein
MLHKIQYVITSVLVAYLTLSPFSIFGQNPNCPDGLSKSQILEFVKGNVPSARLKSLLDDCGLSFVTDAEFETALHDAGAPDEVIDIIKSARRIFPTDDRLACASLEKSTSATAFREYLRLFPNGSCAGFARVRLAELDPAPLPPKADNSSAASSKSSSTTQNDCILMKIYHWMLRSDGKPGALLATRRGLRWTYATAVQGVEDGTPIATWSEITSFKKHGYPMHGVEVITKSFNYRFWRGYQSGYPIVHSDQALMMKARDGNDECGLPKTGVSIDDDTIIRELTNFWEKYR